MFGKAKRFEPEKVCGPPPTAYNPKFPEGGAGPASFPKDGRFKEGHAEGNLTRSHSSSSVGSAESAVSTKSHHGKAKDHTTCNKRITDLQRELQNMTLERNQLLGKKHPFKQSNKENESEAMSSEIRTLNQMIKELQGKLDEAKCLEDEKHHLENERETALNHLESKEQQVNNLTKKIEDLKVSFNEREEELKHRLEDMVKVKAQEKEEIEVRIAEYELKLENLENVKVELTTELDAIKEAFKAEKENLVQQHEETLKTLNDTHQKQVVQLENNLQQLIAEHDAETEQLKYEHSRLVEELTVNHAESVSKLNDAHAEELKTLHSSHEEQVTKLENLHQKLQAEHSDLQQKYEAASLSLDMKSDEISTLTTQLEVYKEKLETSRHQAEERFEKMKQSLELDIAQIQKRMTEEREQSEEAIRSHYEGEIGLVNQSNQQLNEMLQMRVNELDELKEKHQSLITEYEEKFERLNTNNQTEKEILMWQMSQQKENLELQLKTDYEKLVDEKNAEHQLKLKELETEISRINEDNANELASLQANFAVELTQERQQHEQAVEQLEKEKLKAIEEKDEILTNLKAKEEELEKLNTQLSEVTKQLQLEVDLLKENNNQLIADLLKFEQEKQLAESQAEEEKIEMKTKNEEEKKEIMSKFEEKIELLGVEIAERDAVIQNLAVSSAESEKLSIEKLENLKKELEESKQSYERNVQELSESHKEEISTLHKNYERVLQNKDEKFAGEIEKLVESHQEEIQLIKNELEDVKVELAASKDESLAKIQTLTSEIAKLEINATGKDNEIENLNQVIQRREKEAADEWIQRETAIMAQVAAEKQLTHEEYENRLREVYGELEAANEKIDSLKKERDAAIDDVAVFQVQMEAQLAALNEQYDQERSMLSLKLKEQMQEIEEINSLKLKEANDQMTALRHQLTATKEEFKRQLELLEQAKEEQVMSAVQRALEPLESEVDDLKRDREELLKLRQEYNDLQARIEPFWEQLEMYEAEKKVLLSQAQTAESSMATLASKYTQLLGHQNSRQKIHHLEKLKQDIFNLRKELTEKNLALEKEKKAKQKLEAKLKEVTGSKKFDPAEAFKVPDTPAAPAPLAQSTAKTSKVRQSIQNEVKRAAPFRANAQSTGFFLSMDDVEKTKADMERERRERIEQRRKASHHFEAFEVDLGNSRRDTYDIVPKLNVTHCIDNKENSVFPHDLSGISPGDEMKKQGSTSSSTAEHLTSTPLQLRQAKP